MRKQKRGYKNVNMIINTPNRKQTSSFGSGRLNYSALLNITEKGVLTCF